MLILDHVVATDAALVGLQVTMLGDGGFTVAGVTAVELEQETFHCYIRQLADVAPPGLADELCADLAADDPPAPDPGLLARAGMPLQAGVYDVLTAPITVTAVGHASVRLSWPADYGSDAYGSDEWGIRVRAPYEPSQPYYGHRFGSPTPGRLYRASVARTGLVLLPLVRALDPARVEHYASQLTRGGQPTVLAFGAYGSERSAALVILDGHHKLAAAARTGFPVQLLTFLSPQLLANYGALNLLRPVDASAILLAARRNLGGDEVLAQSRRDELAERWQTRVESRPLRRR